MRTTDLQPLALSSDAGSVLLRVHEQDPRLSTRSYKAQLRERVVVILNAAVAEGRSEPERAIALTGDEIAIAVSCIHMKKGMDGVRDYLRPDKFSELVSIGRALKDKYLHQPLAAIRERNRLNDHEVVSSMVRDGTQIPSETRIHLVPMSFMDTAAYGSCGDYSQLWKFREQVRHLERALDLADTLSLDNKTVQSCKGRNEIESGLVQLIRHTEERISHLEVAVFSSIFAKVHGLKQKNPLTFPSAHAATFLQDLDAGYAVRPDVLARYSKACVELFPACATEAQLLLERYLETVGELARSMPSKTPMSPESFFPVGRFSEAVLQTRKRSRG